MSESVNLTLDYTPRAWQRMCHVNKARFTVLALHRRAGKTELALMELLDCAMSCQTTPNCGLSSASTTGFATSSKTDSMPEYGWVKALNRI